MNKRYLMAILVLALGLAGVGVRLAHTDEPQQTEPILEENESPDSVREASLPPPESLVATSASDDNPTDPADGQTPPSPQSASAAQITWIGEVSSTFQDRCLPCHQWSVSYQEVVQRVQSGQMRAYLEMEHFIAGDQKRQILDWMESGYPER